MRFDRYFSRDSFKAAALEVLLENEVQNNLPISFMFSAVEDISAWLFATVSDGNGAVVLTAACTPPHNIVLYETANRPSPAAVDFLARQLKALEYPVPGVLAERGLARRFALAYTGRDGCEPRLSMHIMQLGRLAYEPKASGHARFLTEKDMFFVPYWEREFGRECGVEHYPVEEHYRAELHRIEKKTHLLWVDGGVPVAQAVQGRGTLNGGVIGGVYCPPFYRGRGYGTAVVAELSKRILAGGKTFCALFADAKNPVSCGIYHKIGYTNVCIFDEISFGQQ